MGVVSPVRLDGLPSDWRPVDGQMDTVVAGISRHEPDASGEARDTRREFDMRRSTAGGVRGVYADSSRTRDEMNMRP